MATYSMDKGFNIIDLLCTGLSVKNIDNRKSNDTSTQLLHIVISQDQIKWQLNGLQLQRQIRFNHPYSTSS